MAAAERIFAVLDAADGARARALARCAGSRTPRSSRCASRASRSPTRASRAGARRTSTSCSRPARPPRSSGPAAPARARSPRSRCGSPTRPPAACSCGGVDLRELDPERWRARHRLGAAAHARCSPARSPRTSRSPIPARRARGSSRRRARRPASTICSLAGSTGLDTVVGDGGRGLSAGEAQRVGLARAFLHDASLVVLDEPTAHLDADMAAAVGGAIERLAAGRTTLLIGHDARLADRADRVVTLEHGRACTLARMAAAA